MKETVENLMWSVYSFVNKEHTKAEMNRVLFNKKKRAATDQEYAQKLITNIGYYQILISMTRQMMEHCFSNNEAPTLDLVAYVVNDIKSRGSDDIFFNEVKDNYLGSNANKSHGMGFVEKLEYDYPYNAT